MKTCPCCGSTKIIKNQGKFYCKKCGFVNLSSEEVNKKLVE